jgi:hypothetical protein
MDISFIYWFMVIRSSSVFSGVFRAEEDDEGDRRSGDSTMVYVQALLEAFLNMPLTSASFTDVLSGQKQYLCLRIILLKCQIIRISYYKTYD